MQTDLTALVFQTIRFRSKKNKNANFQKCEMVSSEMRACHPVKKIVFSFVISFNGAPLERNCDVGFVTAFLRKSGEFQLISN